MAYAYFVVHQPNGLAPTQNGGVTPGCGFVDRADWRTRTTSRK